MITKPALLADMIENFKNIKVGTHYGKLEEVYASKNRNNEPVINFILEYYDTLDNKIKYVVARYNMSGGSRDYLLSTSLIPALYYHNINISYDMNNAEIMQACKKLIGKTLLFSVEETPTNKNIRLVCSN